MKYKIMTTHFALVPTGKFLTLLLSYGSASQQPVCHLLQGAYEFANESADNGWNERK
jgi:hypothetical protein